jgi:TonB family protein
MENLPVNFGEENKDEKTLKKFRPVIYMGIILGTLILIMAYLALFTDDPWKIFRTNEKVVTLVGDQSKLLNKSETMDNEQIRASLVQFIEAFYYDQRKGYFDPPSYFAPITKTYYNYHNLTYESLKDLYWRLKANMKGLERTWMPNTLEFVRTDSGIVAKYWTKERYFRPSIRQQQSAEIKYEMIIDENGKIVSLREAEIKNFQTYVVAGDTVMRSLPINPGVNNNPPPAKDLKTYDVSLVDVVPQFPGGQTQLTRFIQTNLRYPAVAKEKKIQGNVYVSFFVEKDGSLRNMAVRQGLGNGCDEEAIRLVSSFPPWTPGMIGGNPVTTFYILPVPFVLN